MNNHTFAASYGSTSIIKKGIKEIIIGTVLLSDDNFILKDIKAIYYKDNHKYLAKLIKNELVELINFEPTDFIPYNITINLISTKPKLIFDFNIKDNKIDWALFYEDTKSIYRKEDYEKYNFYYTCTSGK